MPRHNRSVTARRSPRPRKCATVAGLPGSSKSKAELFDRLHRAFDGIPKVSETPQRMRKRYIDAIDSVADYLESIGADALWVERFDELSEALEDLVEGKLTAILRPEIPNS
jgi:predicted ATP-dependent Lon-type protease